MTIQDYEIKQLKETIRRRNLLIRQLRSRLDGLIISAEAIEYIEKLNKLEAL